MGQFSDPAALIAIATGFLILFAGGCGSDEGPQGNSNSPQSKAAVRQYRAYLERNTADLVTRVEAMVDQIKAGELEEAQSTYDAARVPYGHIKPAARLFGNLDSRIDSSPGEVPADKLDGFHRIEKGLWAEGTTAGLTTVARELLANLLELQGKTRTIRLQPAGIAQSGTELLDELSASAIRGKEERYSHLDLVDLAAGIEGVEAAFIAGKPPIVEEDPELATGIEAEFEDTYAGVKSFGIASREPNQPQPEAPGTSFVLYVERTQAEFHAMDQKIAALTEQLSRAPALIREH